MNGEAMVVDQPPPKEYGGSSNYIVSAQKPTVVNAAIVGNFRTETELDMIISRVNRIEHFLVTEEGLKPYREIPVFGRIATLNSFRLPGEVLNKLIGLLIVIVGSLFMKYLIKLLSVLLLYFLIYDFLAAKTLRFYFLQYLENYL